MYNRLSNWLGWRAEVSRKVREAVPADVADEVEQALDIHGDNLLDLYTDELVDATIRANTPKELLADDLDFAVEFVQEYAALAAEAESSEKCRALWIAHQSALLQAVDVPKLRKIWAEYKK
jgi:hypothetical protein